MRTCISLIHRLSFVSRVIFQRFSEKKPRFSEILKIKLLEGGWPPKITLFYRIQVEKYFIKCAYLQGIRNTASLEKKKR